MSQVVVGLPNNSYKPITNTAWVRTRLCRLLKRCTRLAAASDKVYQLLADGWWFSPDTPVSSTTKTGRHDIAEILLKVALNRKNQINQRQYRYIQTFKKNLHRFVSTHFIPTKINEIGGRMLHKETETNDFFIIIYYFQSDNIYNKY